MLEPREIACLAVKALDDKKARNIKVLKTDKQTVLADYFIICNGTSSTHIKALTEETDGRLSDAGEPPLRRRGTAPALGCCWTLAASLCISLPKKRASSTTLNGCGAIPRRLSSHPFWAPDNRGFRIVSLFCEERAQPWLIMNLTA